jgi:hypothetical protein
MNGSPDAFSAELASLIRASRLRLAVHGALRGAALGSIAGAAFILIALGFVGAASAIAVALAILVAAGAAAGLLAWRAPDSRIAAEIEARTPAFRNTLITAVELRDRRSSTPVFLIRRIAADASRAASTSPPSQVFPLRRAFVQAAGAGVPLAILAAIATSRPDLIVRVREQIAPGSGRGTASVSGSLEVTAVVTPPPYARLPAQTVLNPDRIEALEGSRIDVRVAHATGALRVRTNSAAASPLTRRPDGTFQTLLSLRNGFVVFEGDTPGERRLISLIAVPDHAPSVRLTSPGRDLLYPDAARTVSFEISATDDLELRSLRLEYTKVSGSGESFEFKEGEIPLTVARRDARAWTANASAALGSLGLEPGDTLVYRASAADARPAGLGSSDAFVIEIGKAAEGLAEGFAIADDQNKYAISQQMVILKTERLEARRGTLPNEDFVSAAQAIAAEQRMVRAEFVFMMGGEVEDEEVEAELSNELQEGRLENRGQADMRTAIRLMSDAEQRLTAANTAAALPVERSALAALQNAFSRNRYILRTIAARNRIDTARRLSGDRSGAADWVRPPQVAPDLVAPVRTIVRQIVELSSLDAWTPAAARTAADLAERTLQLGSRDVSSPSDSAAARQTAARHLMDASRRAIGPPDLARARSDLQSAVSALAPLARAVTPPAALSNLGVSPAVRGAMADALHGPGVRRD